MKRTIPNRKLTDNFWLYEFIEGTLMPLKAVRMNWENIKEFDKYKVQIMADDAQYIRNRINQRFKGENRGKEIGVEITSGWRCLMWELFKKRSGKGRHPLDGFDWRPSNVSADLSDKILAWAHKEWSPRVGGWDGGFAIAWPNRESPDEANHLWGFAHHDRRGVVARWTYKN